VTGLFAAAFAALYAGHQVGDLWVQTHAQATAKGLPGWPGRLACARHVLALTAAIGAAVAVMAAVTGAPVHALPAVAGLAVNAASHYWADRRSTLAGLADWLGRTICPGKGAFYRLGSPRPGRDDNPTLGTGAYQLDQAWHIAWLFAAALIIAGGAS